MVAKKGDTTIPYGTVKLLHTAKEMRKHCAKADRKLSELLTNLGEDTLLSDAQRSKVRNSCVRLRDAFQFSIKMFEEVDELWQSSSSSTTKPPAKRPSKGKGSSGGSASLK